MIFRATAVADAGLVLACRNDPRTRKNTIASTSIQSTSHLAWLAAVIEDPDRELAIVVVREDLAGTVPL